MNDNEIASNLLDLARLGMARFIEQGKTRGYVTFGELAAVMPSEQLTASEIESVMEQLFDMAIDVREVEDDS